MYAVIFLVKKENEMKAVERLNRDSYKVEDEKTNIRTDCFSFWKYVCRSQTENLSRTAVIKCIGMFWDISSISGAFLTEKI